MNKLKFSVFYRLCERDRFFDKFWNREQKKYSAEIAEILKMNLYETMEIIVVHILNRNVESLEVLLTRTDAKYARAFFDYIMGTEIKYKNRAEVKNTIETVFNVRGNDDGKVNK